MSTRYIHNLISILVLHFACMHTIGMQGVYMHVTYPTDLVLPQQMLANHS